MSRLDNLIHQMETTPIEEARTAQDLEVGDSFDYHGVMYKVLEIRNLGTRLVMDLEGPNGQKAAVKFMTVDPIGG